MAKLTLQQTLDKSLKTAKQYIDAELAKKADTHNHPYLPTTGGTMTGRVAFNNSGRIATFGNAGTNVPHDSIATQDNYIEIAAPQKSSYDSKTGIIFHHCGTSTSALEYVNTDNYNSYFNFKSDESTWDVRINGNKVYHTGNKPTPADIGAAVLLDKTITDGFKSAFRTQITGSSANSSFISLIKTTTNIDGASAWSTGFAWGKGDTQGYIMPHYNNASPSVIIGAGSADNILWTKSLAFTDNTIPLSGTSSYDIAGSLLFANSGTTSGAFRGIQGKNGETDLWRFGGSQTGANGGYTEIASADDGNEPIYVRQYTGEFSTLVRTATLLDASGNTTFPGTVTASSFSGSLPNTKRRYKKVIDLTNTTTYPIDKWYPCTAGIPNDGLQTIEVANQLDGSSKPSWCTHANGFTCNLHLMVIAHGWGVTSANSICLNHSYGWCNTDPCGYSQLTNSSNAVLWLRGGGKYNVYTSWDATWTPRTASTTLSEQTVAPVTSCPSISLTRATMMANINGNASSVGGYSVWVGTQTEYNNLSSKSSSTIYYIK